MENIGTLGQLSGQHVFLERDEETYAIKPMNCPRVLMYKEEKHSYRELPLKVAEFGKVHRYERSGVLSGLFGFAGSRRMTRIFSRHPRDSRRVSGNHPFYG